MATDTELLDAWCGGDPQAGNALFQRHFDAICRFFRNKVGHDEVEDLVQRTMLACVASHRSFRRDASFRTYLFTLARNEVYAHYTRRRPKQDALDLGTVSVEDLGPSPTHLLAARDEELLLLRALRRIPLDLQIALELHFYEAMTGPELAVVLDIPEGTVRSRLRRAKECIKQQIEQLASSPQLRRSTLGDLDQWAGQLRERLGGVAERDAD